MGHDGETDRRKQTQRLGRCRRSVVASFGAALALVLAGCGDARESTVAADGGGADSELADTGANSGSEVGGIVQVRVEPVDGVFVEGFEIGLRFETDAGEVLASTLWSDFVRSTGRPEIDAYYDSVLRQPVHVGTIRLFAEVNVGIGPPPSTPDLDGDLPCQLAIEVEPGSEPIVEVGFDGSDDCLRLITAPTGSQGESRPGSSLPTTSTTRPQPASLAVGTSHYVDIDLECQAFELGGIWVLVDGDTSDWQPPGERHEGGTFTIDSPGRGTFVGDAEGTKTATFERIDDGAEPPCAPQPRPTA